MLDYWLNGNVDCNALSYYYFFSFKNFTVFTQFITELIRNHHSHRAWGNHQHKKSTMKTHKERAMKHELKSIFISVVKTMQQNKISLMCLLWIWHFLQLVFHWIGGFVQRQRNVNSDAWTNRVSRIVDYELWPKIHPLLKFLTVSYGRLKKSMQTSPKAKPHNVNDDDLSFGCPFPPEHPLCVCACVCMQQQFARICI